MRKSLNRSALFILLPSVIIFAMCRLTDFNGLYGQDAHEYLRYAMALKTWMTTGTPPGDYFWPLNYPLYGAILSILIRNCIITMQLISILAFTCSAWFVMKSIKVLCGSNITIAGIYTSLFFLLSPYMLRFSMLVMSDMLAVFFVSGAYYFYLCFSKDRKESDFVIMVFCAASAIMTRYAAIVIIIPVIIHSIILVLKKGRILYLLAAFCIAFLCFAPHLLFRGSHTMGFLSHPWIKDWNLHNFIKNDFITADGHEHFRVINLLVAFSSIAWPSFFFVGMVLIWFFRKPDFLRIESKIILTGVILYALFIAGIPFQNMRFLLLSFPLIALFFYPVFVRVLSLAKNASVRNTIFACIACIQIVFCVKALKYVYAQNRIESEIARYIHSRHPQAIYTLGMEGALQTYQPESSVISLYGTLLKDVRHPAYVLISEAELEEQYRNKEPALNWLFIKLNFPVHHLKSFSHGWELYEVR